MTRALPVALLALLALPALAAEEPLPEGCVEVDGRYECHWRFTRQSTVEGTPHEFVIPVFPRTLATVSVFTQGADTGWGYQILERGPDGDRIVSFSQRSASPERARLAQQGTDPHLLFVDVTREHLVSFHEYGGRAVGNEGVMIPSPPSEFGVTYVAEPLAEGAPPSRPAATRDDPHLAGGALDARAGGVDLLAAWLDDARLDDGLFDVHLAVRDLRDPGFGETQLNVHRVEFTVLDQRIIVQFNVEANESAQDGFVMECLVRETDALHPVMRPVCGYDLGTSTLSAVLPERVVGSPGAGELFTAMYANVHTHTQLVVAEDHVTAVSDLRIEDELTEQRYPFALGGPEVWHALNPRLTTPPAPWYHRPLAAENVADTLQVAGALAASSVFLGGLVLVRRRRERARRLLDEVDAVVRAHQDDSREALLALGRLETRLDGMYRDGRITEGEYQLASQRIATAATRFALRQELGLDDGTPGERVGVRP